jgi:hypothetical protein
MSYMKLEALQSPLHQSELCGFQGVKHALAGITEGRMFVTFPCCLVCRQVSYVPLLSGVLTRQDTKVAGQLTLHLLFALLSYGSLPL